ncbi:MAG TPA: hypothetical protein DFI00_04585 [Rhodospirillaceae bacterium]|nr:hypothetical protein [Alphaproteobacteria bacterium]OUT40865.1 MAG: hypothetical protein CBB62_00385 [Micavibrio sp. TMED2]HCI46547.1 hypothetical protein [Rhodospirillaceae bacterium]MAS47655.1 hypothetical protein [Alphaproteobacteria bacterium]MAX96473.1 hypothetical protein [Alphaproteobacteria bacterium]|tara:strand:+ start:116 stop:1432 length:1317 start_codon:yes stop_codon:yes gene_type:complete
MYSLLMIQHYENTEFNQEETYEFPMARFLEYTDEATIKQLKPKDEKSLKILTEIPCIIMSEKSRAKSKNYYINFDIYKIEYVELNKNNIIYKPKLMSKHGRYEFNKNEEINEIFGLHEWELNRTHWAIKNKEISEITKIFKINKIEKNDKLKIQKEENTQVEINDISEFIKKINEYRLKIENTHTSYYRGHDKKGYDLEPSIFRKHTNSSPVYLINEDLMIQELLTENPHDFSNDKYTIDKLVRMQHYGMPTRLLDITSSPLIALYFSCYKEKDEDGEIIIFNIRKDSIKFYNSDTVSCIANLSMLPHKDKEKIETRLSKEKFNESEPIKKLNHLIKNEKPYFKEIIDPNDIEKVIPTRGRNQNDRISSQSGAFFIFGKDAFISPEEQEQMEVKKITIKNKQKILEQLETLGIKPHSVFPGTENFIKYIKEIYGTHPN